MVSLLAAPIDLSKPADYIHWGWIQISVVNALIILIMIAILILAIAIPFPRGER
jgi:hypothetical protein